MDNTYAEMFVLLRSDPAKYNGEIYEKAFGKDSNKSLDILLEEGYTVIGVTPLNFGVLINLAKGTPPQ